jgi:hypothetical protein
MPIARLRGSRSTIEELRSAHGEPVEPLEPLERLEPTVVVEWLARGIASLLEFCSSYLTLNI